MRISIKRCPLMRLAGHQDLTWEVTDWQQSVVHPTYNLMGGCGCWLMQGCAFFLDAACCRLAVRQGGSDFCGSVHVCVMSLFTHVWLPWKGMVRPLGRCAESAFHLLLCLLLCVRGCGHMCVYAGGCGHMCATGQDVRLYPGDQLAWSCTFNTSLVNRTVYGGYAGYSEEM